MFKVMVELYDCDEAFYVEYSGILHDTLDDAKNELNLALSECCDLRYGYVEEV